MKPVEWLVALIFSILIGGVLKTALVMNNKAKIEYLDYLAKCDVVGGELVNTKYFGYRCYGDEIILKGYEYE